MKNCFEVVLPFSFSLRTKYQKKNEYEKHQVKKNWNVVKYVKQNYNLHRKLKYVKRKNFFFYYFEQTTL